MEVIPGAFVLHLVEFERSPSLLSFSLLLIGAILSNESAGARAGESGT